MEAIKSNPSKDPKLAITLLKTKYTALLNKYQSQHMRRYTNIVIKYPDVNINLEYASRLDIIFNLSLTALIYLITLGRIIYIPITSIMDGITRIFKPLPKSYVERMKSEESVNKAFKSLYALEKG
jgi:hypothetical protein